MKYAFEKEWTYLVCYDCLMKMLTDIFLEELFFHDLEIKASIDELSFSLLLLVTS